MYRTDFRQIRKLMAEATDNEDGVINYQEFIPLFLEIIHTQQASSEYDLHFVDCNGSFHRGNLAMENSDV